MKSCARPSSLVAAASSSTAIPGLLAALLFVHSGTGVQAQLQDNDTPERTLASLQARKKRQDEGARTARALLDFRFSDQIEASGIRFTNRIVDDAGKNWKAAHYDHGNGLAAADVDGDGRPDLYFVSQLGSNQLWKNLGDGRFQDITGPAGVGMPDQISVAATFADCDNDGDPDLFVTTVRHGNRLFENLGGGRFRDVTHEAGLEYSGHSSAAVFFDFDNDGLLDLFLCNVGRYTQDAKGEGGFFLALSDAFDGHLHPERAEFSILYRNLGGGRFKDVSSALNLRDGSWSGDAAFCDLNGDRFPDLYVANMQGEDHYYENVAGKRFADRTRAFFPRTPWGSMGARFFDYNNDGRLDLFVTDMHSDMTDGQRRQALKFDPAVEKAKSERFCSREMQDLLLRAPANYIFGNAFYENRGEGKFVERSDELGLETYWPWGASSGDLNADGWEDVFVTAGMGFPFRYGINSVLINEEGRRFVDSEFLLGVEPRAGGKVEVDYFQLDCDGRDRGHAFCRGRSGMVSIRGAVSTRSSVALDLDGDGDLDLVTNEFNDRPQILISSLAAKRKVHFLKIQLVGTASNRDGLGSTVKVSAGGMTQTRYHDGKSGYLSQSSLPLYFGLGEAATVDRIEVSWPSGRTNILEGSLPANRSLRIVESRP